MCVSEYKWVMNVYDKDLHDECVKNNVTKNKRVLQTPHSWVTGTLN